MVAERARADAPTMAHRPPAGRIAILLGLLVAATAVLPVAANGSEFPPGHEGYHTYAEVTAEVAAAATAHPDIVRRFSIGTSHQGRQLWAAKISDNVAVDENEPEVLFDGGHHADEHMSVEMTLRILRWLTDGYGSDPRITRLVDRREIWIVFLVNPDGAEYDIAGGRYNRWRKNRQPTPGTSYIGTDLNRNYDYRWTSAGRTSSDPKVNTYRGPSAFSAPETRAMRDFLASRVIAGRQQIRAAITFHENGRLVMWPYGYTTADVPSDMTKQDHDALVVIGKRMGALSRYRPQQASDLYLTSGTSRDYMYGRYRTFVYTFEMSVLEYPDDSYIGGETARNRESVIYLLERAACPLGVLGTQVRVARCGAFDDDLEVSRGWVVNPSGTDTAPAAGRFSRGDPVQTTWNGPKQLGAAASGRAVIATGLGAGSTPNANDLDGATSVRSPLIDLPDATGQRFVFRYVFAHDSGASTADRFRAVIEEADGTRTTVFQVLGAPTDRDGLWRSASPLLDRWAGQRIRLRFEAVDGGAGNLVEVAIDDVRVTAPS
jgi:carboxypeptidase T